MKFNKSFIRKVATFVLIIGLAFLAVEGAAADDVPQKGFVLFGLSSLYDGTEQIRGGVGEIFDGNEQLVGGLDSLGGALDEEIAGNLQAMKTGLDGEVLPGLSSILDGITGKVVPGLGDIREGLEDKMSPGLGKIIPGLEKTIIPGLQQIETVVGQDVVGGLDLVLGGIKGNIVPALQGMQDGIGGVMVPTLDKMDGKVEEAVDGLDEMIDAGLPQLLDGLSGVSGGIASGMLPLLAPSSITPEQLASYNPGTSSIYTDLALLALTHDLTPKAEYASLFMAGGGPLPPGSAFLENVVQPKVAGLYSGITHQAKFEGADLNPGILQALAMIRAGLQMEGVPGYDPADQDTWGILEGLTYLHEEITKAADPDTDPDGVGLQQALKLIRYGLSMSAAPAHPDFNLEDDDTFGVSEGLTAVLAGLGDPKAEGTVINGLTALRGGLAGPVGDGLDGIVTGLSTEIVPGLGDIKEGMDVIMIPGMYKLIAGFNKTEQVEGESGITEGLTKISHGLANPEFSPNPGGDPGISDGLGLVIDGIRTDVLGGIGELKSGIVEKIMPGLEQISTGISGELQPGFTKVSMLLLAIWLVSLIVFLVVGILIGRAAKARASAGRSTTV